MHRDFVLFPILIKRIVQHRFSRGMGFFTDVRDWLGGWPMEFVHDKDVVDFLEKGHGFKLAKIKSGEAFSCTEFVLRLGEPAVAVAKFQSEVLSPQRA